MVNAFIFVSREHRQRVLTLHFIFQDQPKAIFACRLRTRRIAPESIKFVWVAADKRVTSLACCEKPEVTHKLRHPLGISQFHIFTKMTAKKMNVILHFKFKASSSNIFCVKNRYTGFYLKNPSRHINRLTVADKVAGGSGHPDPEIRGGPASKKNFFGPSGLILVKK